VYYTVSRKKENLSMFMFSFKYRANPFENIALYDARMLANYARNIKLKVLYSSL